MSALNVGETLFVLEECLSQLDNMVIRQHLPERALIFMSETKHRYFLGSMAI